MENPSKPPLTRQELGRLLVSDADAFTQLRFLRHRETTPALQELERAAEDRLPGSVGALADLYHALWSPDPKLLPEEQVGTDRRAWRAMLQGMLASSAYEAAHARTRLSDLRSLIGTIELGNAIAAQVSEEDAEKLREQAAAQREADEANDRAEEAESQADAAEALAQAAAGQAQAGSGQGGDSQPGEPSGEDAGGEPQESSQGQSGDSLGASGMPQSGVGTPAGGAMPQAGAPSRMPQSGRPQRGGRAEAHSGGGTITPEEAQALADELARQAQEARAKAEAAREEAERKQQEADRLAEALLGEPGSEEAAEKLQELARIGAAAMRKAQKKVEEVSETLEAWGLEEGELTREGMPEAMGILERMQKSDAFKKFASLLGRIRRIAARKAKSDERVEGVRVSKPELGRDIRRAVPAELAALATPVTRPKTLVRWARGELRLRGEEAKQRLGEGPVVVCEDSSGSMDGAKRQWAKATTLALAHYAKLRKRSFAWIMFDSRVQAVKVVEKGRLSAKDLLEIAEVSSGGGTSFEAPLDRALEVIREEGLKKADIAFITDGECAVADEWLKEFLAAKEKLQFNVVSVLCDVGATSGSTVEKFSDRVERVSSLDEGDAAAVIGHIGGGHG